MNIQTGESRVVKYRGDEAAWVEQVKICGNETSNQPLQTVAIMLRIEVGTIHIFNPEIKELQALKSAWKM